jgi:predicted membrane-bound spermidine synthase
VLLPFCIAMGATFPLGLAALRRAEPGTSPRAFSYLYGANVLGATLGGLAAAFVLIELLGLRGSGVAVAALNGLVAVGALAASRSTSADAARAEAAADARAPAPDAPHAAAPFLLFTTGLVSMAMEVVWVRQFSPFIETEVYAFASILAIYLGATFAGALTYRRSARASAAAPRSAQIALVWTTAFACALLPLLFADPRLTTARSFALGLARLVPAIAPFCAAVGFLTPMLVDHWSGGDPRRAGRVYAANVVGCVIGPLLASFVLLPWIGERGSLIALSAPLAVIAAGVAWGAAPRAARTRVVNDPRAALFAACGLAAVIAVTTKDYETIYPVREVRRDYSATVIAWRNRAGKPNLFVNGIGMTRLTSIAKLMAHLPLAHLAHAPQRVLVLCFGMGTSFRSSVSWGVPTTAIDLIPSVPALFPYFHPDAARVEAAPGARIVIDDGRRFLERTSDVFDVVMIDPPPPVEAAGSGLLYSREFYALIERRLAPGGIVQQWFPGGEPVILTAIARALTESFPHVRVFHSIEGWGFHFLASREPIPHRDAAALANRLPPGAAADLVEWMPQLEPVDVFAAMLAREVESAALPNFVPDTPALEDDRPINEYYFLRRLAAGVSGNGAG